MINPSGLYCGHSGDHHPNMDTSAPPLLSQPDTLIHPVCGFWRRLVAFLVDGILLGLAGLLLGLLAFDFLAGLGAWGRLVGFIVALIYFGLFDSTAGKGQTPGKRLLQIRVISTSGEIMKIPRSILRYTILGVPYFLNGAMIPVNLHALWIPLLTGMIVFGLGGSLLYLLVFNRRNRRSIHDLATNTIVICTQGPTTTMQPTWRGHCAVIGLLAAAVVAVAFIVPRWAKMGPFPELLKLNEVIQNSAGVQTSSVMVGKTWTHAQGSSQKSSWLQVRAVMKERRGNYRAISREIAGAILQSYPKVREYGAIQIDITYGYDIGIASSWVRQHFSYSPDDLMTVPPAKP